MDWNDLRFVTAVAATGSLNAAAKTLGVNHATVLRRVNGLEERHGVRLFLRSARGYRLAPNAHEIVKAIEAMSEGAEQVRRALAGAATDVVGRVRLTSTDTFCQLVLPPILARFAAKEPGISVNLLCSNAHVDMDRPDAEITLRPAAALSDGMRGTQVATLGFGAYGPKGRATDDWIGFGPPLDRARPALWMADNIAPERVRARADSFLVAARLVAAGVGNCFLPVIVAAQFRELLAIEMEPEIAVPIWVATHRDLHDAPGIAALRRHLEREIAAVAPVLAGRAA